MKKEIKANHHFRESRSHARASARHWQNAGGSAALGAASGAEQVQARYHREHSRGRADLDLSNGDFIDLCAGPHVMRTGNIGAFKLTSVASAYYKGDEKNPQLQRIYGTAFKNKTELDAYFKMLEEAKKRDHRKIGAEMELFTFDDDVGPGLAALAAERRGHHRGTGEAREGNRVRCRLSARAHAAYRAREACTLTSGHLPYYAESMFPPMELAEGVEAMHRDALKREENDDAPTVQRSNASTKYYLKAMNCPHHHQHLCGGAAQLSRSAAAPGRIRHLLSLRAMRRTLRPDARALAQHERRAHLLHCRSSSRRSSMP